MGDLNGVKGDLRLRAGLEVCALAVEMLSESLGLTDLDASMMMSLLILGIKITEKRRSIWTIVLVDLSEQMCMWRLDQPISKCKDENRRKATSNNQCLMRGGK